MEQVLTASRPELIEVFTGLSPRTFRRLVGPVGRRGGRLVVEGSTAASKIDRAVGAATVLPVAHQQGRTDLDARTLARRRDAFLEAALDS